MVVLKWKHRPPKQPTPFSQNKHLHAATEVEDEECGMAIARCSAGAPASCADGGGSCNATIPPPPPPPGPLPPLPPLCDRGTPGGRSGDATGDVSAGGGLGAAASSSPDSEPESEEEG